VSVNGKRAATALALAGLLTSCGAGEAPRPGHSLSWTDCTAEVQCSTLSVPADWRDPGGPATALNLVRLPASGHRLGSVVVSLGSGNGTNALLGRAPAPLRALAEHFDVVVFDPPGLGRADNGTLVRCDPAPSVYGLVLDRTEAGWAAQARANAAYDASCRKAAGHAYHHLTSWQIANDLDALRAALGEKTLRYLGNSYGTSYGQAYAEHFGARIERMYLDGVADHTRPDLTAWLTDHARTQERQLRAFGDWCAATPACALHGLDATAVWDEVAAAGAPRVGMLIGLTPPRWRDLATGLAAARAGDFGRLPAELPPEPFGSVQPALLCHDFMPAVPGYREFLAIEERLRKVAPHVGWLAGRVQVGRCVGINGGPAYPPAPPKAHDLPPILIGIGKLDNNTPDLGAEHVAEQLPGARTVHHGDGHAAYLLGNRCLAGHVQAYFTDGTLPPVGTECAAELPI
jgi:pimeloyl-ACP methyl ester carboxylesterase